MSNLIVTDRAGRRGAGLAAMLLASALAAGCSTDVQRFGHTGSLQPTASIASPTVAAPVEPVQSASLTPPSTYDAGTGYRGAPEPTPAAAAGYVTVAPGDTTFSVARRSGVTVGDLAAANDLQYPYDIKIGQRLAIPAGGTVPATPAPQPATRVASRGDSAHTVMAGDTLYNIAQRYGVGVGALADANRLDDTGAIKIGQTLTIPSGAAATAQGGPLDRRKVADTDNSRVLGARRVAEEPAPEERQVARVDPREHIEPLPAPPERAAAKFRWPVRGRIVSRFGMAADGNRNDGVNIAVPEGASVKAADNGVVAYAGDELKGYGNLVLIRHANDWVTAYAHNSTLLVSRGETVKRGQIIAKAGQTGSVDKPQVHFEVRRGAKAVDPLDYLDPA